MKWYGKYGRKVRAAAAAAADRGIYTAAAAAPGRGMNTAAAAAAKQRRRRRLRICFVFFSNIQRTIKIWLCNISESTVLGIYKILQLNFWVYNLHKKNSFWPETSFGPKISWPGDLLLGDLGDQMYHFIHLTLRLFSTSTVRTWTPLDNKLYMELLK